MSIEYDRALRQLKKDVQELRTDVRSVVDDLKNGAATKLQDEQDLLREQGQQYVKQIRQAYGELRRREQHVVQRLHDTVEERPVASLLTAVGIGLVLGRLARTKRAA